MGKAGRVALKPFLWLLGWLWWIHRVFQAMLVCSTSAGGPRFPKIPRWNDPFPKSCPFFDL